MEQKESTEALTSRGGLQWASRRQRHCLRCTACDGAGNDNGFHWMSLHYSLQLIAPSGPCCPHAFVEQAEPPLALRVQTGTVQPLQTVRTTHDATRVSANSGRSSYDQTLPRVPNCPHIPWPRADLSSHLW